jgi:hypothetical protein
MWVHLVFPIDMFDSLQVEDIPKSDERRGV